MSERGYGADPTPTTAEAVVAKLAATASTEPSVAIYEHVTNYLVGDWAEAPEGATTIPDYDGFGEAEIVYVPRSLWDAFRSSSRLTAALREAIRTHVEGQYTE